MEKRSKIRLSGNLSLAVLSLAGTHQTTEPPTIDGDYSHNSRLRITSRSPLVKTSPFNHIVFHLSRVIDHNHLLMVMLNDTRSFFPPEKYAIRSMPNSWVVAPACEIESGTQLINKPFENLSRIQRREFPHAKSQERISNHDHQPSEATLTQ